MARRLLIALFASALAACGSDPSNALPALDTGGSDASADSGSNDTGNAPDAGTEDTGEDAEEDASEDAAEDTAPDAEEDTAPDAEEDTAPDAEEDTTPDAGEDTTPDTGEDTTPDSGEDTSPDAEEDTGSAEFGLDTRPVNTTCVAPDRPVTDVDIQVTRAFPSISFSVPTVMTRSDDDPGFWYVAQKDGRIYRFADDNDTSSRTLVLDIRDRVDDTANEAGLLGVAFHPDYGTNGEVYISYTARPGASYQSRVSRFLRNEASTEIDPSSEEILFAFTQPASNHNGGHIDFGPDGYLYIGYGDGGGGGDPFNHGQNPDTWFGTLMRIDVDSAPEPGETYVVPADNPFVDGGGAPEVWAWGLRNPWRFSFDRATGDLWLADVGQNAWEEVHLIDTAGGNYGWPIYEGFACYNGDSRCGVVEGIEPVVVYSHAEGRSITGGYAYRGSSLPELTGRYLFADYLSGRLWAVGYDDDGEPVPEVLADTGLNSATFGEAEDGELYMVDIAAGTIHAIERRGAAPVVEFPQRLSETGCMDPLDASLPGSMLIPYEPNAQFWSDNADKRRWFALPEGETITIDERGDFLFPLGSVLVKDFAIDGQLIETRLMILHEDGVWAGYTYRWNDEQTDAFLLEAGETREVGDQTWIYPSRPQCLACHTSVAERSLGLEVLQLDGDWRYPSGTVANQLATLEHIGVVELDGPGATVGGMPDPFDLSAPLAERARAYLHTNCAQCHQPGGPGRGSLDLHYLSEDLGACSAVPEAGDLGYENPRLIAPRDPDNSVLLGRTNRRDDLGMPPISSTVVDEAGVELLTAWIETDICDGVLPPEVCDNGVDDDTDLDIDCLDSQCASATGCFENTLSCGSPGTVPLGAPVTGSTVGEPNTFAGGACSQSTGGEAVYLFEPPSAGTYCASTVGSGYDTVLYVREACNVPATELGCNDDIRSGLLQSQVTFTADGPVFVFVDGYDGTGSYELNVTAGGC